MKATTSVCCAAPSSTQLLRGVSTSCSRNDGRITKPTCTTTARICSPTEPETEVEMLACLARLEELVPTSSRCRGAATPDSEQSDIGDGGRQHLSQVQLLQQVIDYILDLENTLDFRPDSSVDDVTSDSVDLMRSKSRCNRVSSYDDGAVTSDDEACSPSMSPNAHCFAGDSKRSSTRLMEVPSGEQR